MMLYSKLFASVLSTFLTLKISFPPADHLSPSDGDIVKDLYVSTELIDQHLVWRLAAVLLLAAYSLLHPSSTLFRPWTISDVLTLALTVSGSLLRLWSFSTLGRLFTFQVGFRREHPLIRTGPYRYLVHPSYTGVLAALAGFQLWFGWGGHILYWIPIGSLAYMLIFKRIPNEEAALRAHFTEEIWDAYQGERWRIFPLIY
jgi:protein-S-isoprenylcysteine O-methyltransferase Ste14